MWSMEEIISLPISVKVIILVAGMCIGVITKVATLLSTAKAALASKVIGCAASLDIGTYINPETCPDYVKNSRLGSTAVFLLDYTSFLKSGVSVLKVVIIRLFDI